MQRTESGSMYTRRTGSELTTYPPYAHNDRLRCRYSRAHLIWSDRRRYCMHFLCDTIHKTYRQPYRAERHLEPYTPPTEYAVESTTSPFEGLQRRNDFNGDEKKMNKWKINKVENGESRRYKNQKQKITISIERNSCKRTYDNETIKSLLTNYVVTAT